jgi:hypothetical protein
MNANKPKQNPLESYVTVAERIEKFYDLYPDGRIITHIVDHDAERGFILMRAEVYRNLDDALPAATGHAYELKAEGYVQRTSYIEVCETSSVGRALAMAGFEVRRVIASREEMEKSQRGEENERSDKAPLKVVPLQKTPLHQEVIDLWGKLQVAGNHLFANGTKKLAHLIDTAAAKGWEIGTPSGLSAVPEAALKSYKSVLIDLLAKQQEAR